MCGAASLWRCRSINSRFSFSHDRPSRCSKIPSYVGRASCSSPGFPSAVLFARAAFLALKPWLSGTPSRLTILRCYRYCFWSSEVFLEEVFLHATLIHSANCSGPSTAYLRLFSVLAKDSFPCCWQDADLTSNGLSTVVCLHLQLW